MEPQADRRNIDAERLPRKRYDHRRADDGQNVITIVAATASGSSHHNNSHLGKVRGGIEFQHFE